MKVVITPRGFANYGLTQIEWMQSKGLSVHFNDTGLAYTYEQFLKLTEDADAIIVGVDRMDRSMLEHAPKLKVICKFGVGTDNIDLDYCQKHNIYVGRTVGSNSQSVAEHVVAMMFNEAKNIYASVKDVKENQWKKLTGREISGKKIGIIGFGMIGKYLADFTNGIGMDVYAYDAFGIKEEDAKKHSVKISTFDEIIEQCDYISLHVPLLDSTRNMISTQEFLRMKPEACLLNAARGGVVDEEALYKALSDGKIRSACFDVFSTEPPVKNDKLVQLPNFFLTPHTAARTIESEVRTCQMSSEIIVKYLLGD